MNTLITSDTGRLITIRPPHVGDLTMMVEFINSIGREDIYVNVNPNDLYTIDQEKAYLTHSLAQVSLSREVHLIAFDREDMIGSLTVTKGEKRRRHVGTFGLILAQAYRNQGIGFKFSTVGISEAFSTLDIRVIILTLFSQNIPAHKLYRKLGFRNYGILPKGLSYKESFDDEILMYLPRPETV
jgi:RimJ/RimL family protein N-acetyltransferase